MGNVPQVKTVLTSVVAALACYQVLLMAVGYGWVNLPFLKPKAASFTHRSVGGVIFPVTLLVGWMCLAYFGIEDGIEHASGGESPAGPRRRIGRARSGVSSPHIDAWRPLSAQVNWATAQGAG